MMIETREIETGPDLVFDCSVGGDASAPLVLMLHGFCVSRYFWDNQIPVLATTGYFAVAPNQRGYAVGARPDPTDFDNYRIDKLIGDANDIVTSVGHVEAAPLGIARAASARRSASPACRPCSSGARPMTRSAA